MKMPSNKYHIPYWWLAQVMAVAVRQQTIIWAKVGSDLCRHMASPDHKKPIQVYSNVYYAQGLEYLIP